MELTHLLYTIHRLYIIIRQGELWAKLALCHGQLQNGSSVEDIIVNLFIPKFSISLLDCQYTFDFGKSDECCLS